MPTPMTLENPMNGLRTPRRAAGFSFIEILVVMGIIGVLAGLGAVIITIMVKGRPKRASETTVVKVKSAIDTWKLKFYEYPPTTLEGLSKAVGLVAVKYSNKNATNEAIEALFQALHVEGYTGNPEFNEEQELKNIDDDRLSVKLTNRGLDLREIVDGWGNPLVYFLNTEYAKYDQNPPAYEGANGEPYEPRPWRDSGGGFVNPNGFQIFSIGEDQKPNTDDDITGW